MSLTELFCEVDDFCTVFEPIWHRQLLTAGFRQRHRSGRLALSEVMTLMIHFHQSAYRDFKHYYEHHVKVRLRAAFPKLVSYTRFVELIPQCAYLTSCYDSPTGLAFVDATPLAVCHNRRISRHRVFKGLAERGKTSMGWFFGFKLHIVVNDRGGLLAFKLTAGNVDDRAPLIGLCQGLWGKLFADKGYISQAKTTQLAKQGLELITQVRRNMKPVERDEFDQVLLRRRSLVETIFDQLKNISQVEHSRHRSPINFMINVVAGLIAYTWQPKKPSLNIETSYPTAVFELL